MKDLIGLFWLIATQGIYSAYGLFINYHIAYIKQDHPSYSKQLIYTTVILLDLGMVFSNYFIMNLISKFGIRTTLQIGGNISMLASILAIFFTNIFVTYFVYLLFGGVYQIFTFSTLFYLGLKYEKDLVKYSGYIFTGSSMSYLIFGYGSSLIMNYQNFEESKLIVSGDLQEYVFPDQVSNRFPIFLGINGLVTIMAAFVTSWILETEEDLFSDASLAMGKRGPKSIDEFNEEEKRQILDHLKMKSQMFIFMTNSLQDDKIGARKFKKSLELKAKAINAHAKSQGGNYRKKKRDYYFSGKSKGVHFKFKKPNFQGKEN
jgi:MFS family permease